MSSTAMRRKGLVIVNALIEKVDNSLVLKMPSGLWLKRIKWSYSAGKWISLGWGRRQGD